MGFAAGRDENEPVGEMNTTPLIDVMLVLLVMFIITIPLQSHSVKVDLPDPKPTLQVQAPPPEINKIVVRADGVVTWNGSAIDLATLRQYLDASVAMTPEPELHVQPDASARYDKVDQVLAVIKKAGITKMGFVGNEQYAAFPK